MPRQPANAFEPPVSAGSNITMVLCSQIGKLLPYLALLLTQYMADIDKVGWLQPAIANMSWLLRLLVKHT